MGDEGNKAGGIRRPGSDGKFEAAGSPHFFEVNRSVSATFFIPVPMMSDSRKATSWGRKKGGSCFRF
jgi:hypothetical protein